MSYVALIHAPKHVNCVTLVKFQYFHTRMAFRIYDLDIQT